MQPVNDEEVFPGRERKSGVTELGTLFREAAELMARLRASGGCPWDREQTPESIRKYTLEETYEVLDAIERQDWPHLCEELGDLLLQVLFYAQMAEEAGHFDIGDVLHGLGEKLVRRHPHVFGEAAAAAAGNQAAALSAVGADGSAVQTVLGNWEAIKRAERKSAQPAGKQESGYLANVLRAQSALGEAAKLGKAAGAVGFDWPGALALLDKVREETDELARELAPASAPAPEREAAARARAAEELGDLLFTAANLARHLHLDPETVLRDANAKFRRRFTSMEKATEQKLELLTAEELEAAWEAAKAREATEA